MKLKQDVREMNLVRVMGFAAFCIVEFLVVYAAIHIKADQLIALITAQTAVFGIIWAAVTGKNIVEMKKTINNGHIKAE